MKNKSFLQNLWNFISGNDDGSLTEQISAKEAIEIQKKYIAHKCDATLPPNTPPYIEIAKQLFSEKNEVFIASVYYLERIAINETKYVEPIVELLKHYLKISTRSDDDKRFLKQRIHQIEKHNIPLS